MLCLVYGNGDVKHMKLVVNMLRHLVNLASTVYPCCPPSLQIPPIDKMANDEKVRLSTLQCDIVFEDVSFTYPTRPDVLVLDHFSWHLRPGQNLAIVGASGSGKSTLVQLLQRLYDPDSGRITVDGVDLRDLDLAWWRSCLGVVSQEPTLFAGSLRKNICLGKPNATLEEVEAAAKLAHAHDFISRLPEAYETVFVAQDGGGVMSGGQKQRVAIARALIRDPKLLLLDEATSALDTRSEKAVQVALDEARKGRTTVTVAHRLSTVRDADVILVMERGRVVEAGSHEELMVRAGVYANLVMRGLKEKEDESDDDSDDDNAGSIIRATQQILLVDDPQTRFYRTSIICGAFGGLVAIHLICYTLDGYAFGVAGERLTTRCRILLFETILKQEVGWFDIPENQPDALAGRLAADVPTLQNMTGRRLASMLETFVFIVSSLFIAFFFSWQIALVSLAYFPILVIAGVFEMQTWSAEVTRKSVKGASLAQEVFSASKTVSALQAEEYFTDSYTSQALLSRSLQELRPFGGNGTTAVGIFQRPSYPVKNMTAFAGESGHHELHYPLVFNPSSRFFMLISSAAGPPLEAQSSLFLEPPKK
ncbi:Multidrug resistance protein 3 [Echinococcus granulosus]|uniref:Multidrug resistance protein 3 n=1 Tax=Echinococcus granulosus TaxID=6210 RepID=W6U4G1_ECHGR|nr:Multidrug resistance protein 3 [Echinococcus granulosus]EUB56005.1 Multidrug resistance protein 3 [Echinococcus granulosus]